MSQMWENIINQSGKYSRKVLEKSKDYFNKAVDKGEELSQLGKIQFEIEKLKRDLKTSKANLGEVVFNYYEKQNTNYFNNDEYKICIEEIDKLNLYIAEREKAKVELKNQSEKE
jgi:hypothetical protein